MSSYPFTPSATSNFNFQPTLDGRTYTVVVWWNMYRQGWYLSTYDLSGIRLLSKALVGSPNDYDINLVAGLFAVSRLVFRGPSQTFEVTP